MTVSLGVLKEKHQNLFSPELPNEKVLAIEKMGFGLMNKITLEFPEVFWDENDPGIQILRGRQLLGETRSSEWTNKIAMMQNFSMVHSNQVTVIATANCKIHFMKYIWYIS